MQNTIYKHENGKVTSLVKIAQVDEGEAVYSNLETTELFRIYIFEVIDKMDPVFIYFENNDHAEKLAIAWHKEQIRILELHLKSKNK